MINLKKYNINSFTLKVMNLKLNFEFIYFIFKTFKK